MTDGPASQDDSPASQDDEQAQAVLEGLAGMRRCEHCGDLIDALQSRAWRSPSDQRYYGGPFLCIDCWLDLADDNE